MLGRVAYFDQPVKPSAAQIDALQQHLKGGRFEAMTEADLARYGDHSVVAELAEVARLALEQERATGVFELVRAKVIALKALSLKRDEAHAACNLYAALLRFAQDELGASAAQRQQIKALFGQLIAASSWHDAGFVHGPKAAHRPQHGSWSADALHWIETLEGAPEPAPSKPTPRPPARVCEVASAPLDPSDFCESLRGRHLAIVGGDSREDAHRRIDAAFLPASSRWFTVERKVGRKRLKTLIEQVTHGSINAVVILRDYIAEAKLKAACLKREGMLVVWANGYGVEQINQALIEREA